MAEVIRRALFLVLGGCVGAILVMLALGISGIASFLVVAIASAVIILVLDHIEHEKTP